MKKILTTILSIILTLTITIEILYTGIANSITEKEIKESIKTNLLTGLIYDEEGNKTEIFNTIVRLTKLSEEDVLKIMENETANEIITDVVNSIYDYNLTGDEKAKYTKIEIINLVEDNIDKVLSEIDYNITPNEREEVINYTRNNTDYILETIYSTNIGGYTK